MERKTKKIIVQENKCIDNCQNNDKYIFQYGNKCYSKCPEETHLINNSLICIKNIIDLKNKTSYNQSYEIINNEIQPSYIQTYEININENQKINCKLNELFNDKCNLSNVDMQNIVYFVTKKIKEGELDLLLTNNANKLMNDYILKGDNIIYQSTSTFNQNNKEYQNLSTILLNKCEEILKNKYKIKKEDNLIIFKYEYYISGLYISIINYIIFYNNTQLDLNYCKEENIHINLNIPVEIDEKKLFLYNKSDQYYKNICLFIESDYDMTIFERKKEFNNKNLSLCQKNCSYIR